MLDTLLNTAPDPSGLAPKINIRISQLPEAIGLPLPCYATEGSSGLDLVAAVPENTPVFINPGDRVLIPTGLSIELPPGTEAQIRPRSGLALKHGITVLNTPGTIDSDYRGPIGIILQNHGRSIFPVHRGDRIAQIVFVPVLRVNLLPSVKLSGTERGLGGFGSTGTKTSDSTES